MNEELDISHQVVRARRLEIITLEGHLKAPVNICEQKNNVGTLKMHMTLSRITTGLEGISRCNTQLRPAREEKKRFGFVL